MFFLSVAPQHDESDTSTLPLTATFDTPGFWKVRVTSAVRYNDDCGDDWTGSDATDVVFAAQAAPPFTVETKPDTEIAIRNEYVKQTDTVEVLTGWRARYTAPGQDPTRWQFRRLPNGPWKFFSVRGNPVEANPLEWPETNAGEFKVRYARGASFDQFSAERSVTVGEIDENASSLQFKVGGFYTRATAGPIQTRSVVNFPFPAMTVTGRVKPIGTVRLTKIKSGLIRGIEGTRKVRYDFLKAFWDNNPSPKGTKATFPEFFDAQSIPSIKCDVTAAGAQLVPDDTRPADLGQPYEFPDAPHNPDNPIKLTQKDALMKDLPVWWTIQKDQQYDLTFTDWLVVFNTETKQYVPVKQGGWKLAWDTSNQKENKWKADPTGEVKILTRPVEAKDSALPYMPLKPGPDKTVTKP